LKLNTFSNEAAEQWLAEDSGHDADLASKLDEVVISTAIEDAITEHPTATLVAIEPTVDTNKSSESSIELAIRYCKQIESLLEQQFAAEGRGLHEKVSSVEDVISRRPRASKLRWIATLRNKVVHEDGFEIENLIVFPRVL
jgi:hypothetical protein